MQGKKQFSEKLFTSFQLSSRVPEDNFYRRIRGVLDLRWLYKATKKFYGTEGQPSIDPVVFFKLILIGYLENLASDRRIINTVSMRLDMLYFIGYDIDEALPWHSTLSRTRQLYGQDIFKKLFREVLKQCIEKGMVSGRRQAIDSVHVKANASMDSLRQKEVLEDGDFYAANLREEEEEEENKKSGDKPGVNETYYSKTDPDSRIATKPGKPRDLKYLGQVSVDSTNHVITEIQCHHADKRDSECLAEIVTGVVENLQPSGLIIEEVVSDANYSSGEALQSLEDYHIRGYIPNPGQYKVEREGFTYDKENDCYVCSQGVQLKYKRTRVDHSGYRMKDYRSSAKDCRHCPIRSQCIGTSLQKRITESIHKDLYNDMHRRMQTAYARTMMRLRQSTAEPVLGTLVNFLGMRRVNTRGIEQAAKCMLVAATAYNLKKLLKFCAPKVNVMAGVKGKIKNAPKIIYFWLGLMQPVNSDIKMAVN